MPVSVTCGSHHTAVITRRGDLISWGMGTSGQTGHGPVVGDVRTLLLNVHGMSRLVCRQYQAEGHCGRQTIMLVAHRIVLELSQSLIKPHPDKYTRFADAVTKEGADVGRRPASPRGGLLLWRARDNGHR